MLLYFTLILAVITAALSNAPVRDAVAQYLETPPAGVSTVIGQSMTEDPSNPATVLEWKPPVGD